MERWHKKGEMLLNEIRKTDLSGDELALWFIGQCGYILKYGEKIVMIDPVLNDILDNGRSCKLYDIPFAPSQLTADYVLCTHGHIDHMAAETLAGLASERTKFVIPVGCKDLAIRCGMKADSLILMQDGKQADLDGISVAAFSASHPTHVLDTASEDMALGYCVGFGDMHLVHLGDTYLTEQLMDSLHKLPHVDIFLPPINGDDLFRARRSCIGNIGAEEAAALAAAIGAELSMPTHFDMIEGNTVDPLRFAAELRRISPTSRWHIPALGERIVYKK